MSEVTTKVSTVAWPLLVASAILTAAAILKPGLLPNWLILVPIGLAIVESVLVMPANILVAIIGVKGLREQLGRLHQLASSESLVQFILNETAERTATAKAATEHASTWHEMAKELEDQERQDEKEDKT